MLTEDLLDSLQKQVTAASAEHMASMGVLFHQYGRIKDMEGITRTKAAPIEAMEEYVKKVGLSKFDYVPGYKYGQFLFQHQPLHRRGNHPIPGGHRHAHGRYPSH